MHRLIFTNWGELNLKQQDLIFIDDIKTFRSGICSEGLFLEWI